MTLGDHWGVVVVQRTCKGCSAVIPPQKGSGKPRSFCTTCRPPRNRPNPRVIPDSRVVAFGTEPAEPAVPAGAEPSLVARYRKRLEAAERLETPEGEHVLYLVGLLVAGGHTASGAAQLSKELRAAMAAALEGAPREADKLDELAARRAAKVAGAS